jgi:glucokinase
MNYVVGIDLGGTHIKAVAVTADGRLLQQESEHTEDRASNETREAWLAKTRDLLLRIEAGHKAAPLGIGLSAPGLAARDGRSIAWMQGCMEAVKGLDWTQQFGSEQLIPVLNDAQAALLGEVWQGVAQGESDVILLTLGTGVGGGVLCDGRLLRGNIGRAGHLGHISLDPDGALDIVRTPGSLEDAIGDCTLLQRSDGRFGSTRDLMQAQQNGDADATKIWNTSLRSLAAGIVGLVNAVDPAVVIIGGGIAKAGNALFDPLQVLLDQWEWRPTGTQVRLVPA